MNAPRLARVLAIARRDWVQELRGRRGALFGGITAFLLLPVAAVRMNVPSLTDHPARQVVVTGEVPEAVRDLPNVVVRDRAQILFHRASDGALLVRGQEVPPEIRKALDDDPPAVQVSHTSPRQHMPGRSILFALISASVLTGAVSESIGGERSRRTLQALLSAAITREEVVLGKWLAWASYGGGAGLLAGLLAVALGRVPAGWWLLPLPMVAASMVALALFLSRHATDVVGGATVSLRYLPALLAFTGLVSWLFADQHPVFAAALPIGGALMAAGATWPGATLSAIAAASTGAFTAGALALTARYLEQPPEPPDSLWRRTRESLAIAAIAAVAWWAPLTAPILWGAAGNPVITDRLPRAPAVWAGAVALLLLSLVHAGRAREPAVELGLVRAPGQAWAFAVVVGLVLAISAPMAGLVPLPHALLLSDARFRLGAAVEPTWVGPAGLVVAVVAQEILFRGWVQRRVGPALGTLAFALVVSPLEPLSAFVAGAALASVTRLARGSVGPAILARLVWAPLVALAPSIAPVTALLLGGGTAAALWGTARYRSKTTER